MFFRKYNHQYLLKYKLVRSIKIQKKVSSLNFDWPNYKRVLLKLDEELDELKSAINSKNESIFAGNVAKELVGGKNVITEVEPSMGGEDFSYLLNDQNIKSN